MVKNIISFTVFASMMILMSCAPQNGANKTGRPDNQVTEQAVTNLTLNYWCQQNPTTGASEYRWGFDKKFKVTVKNLSTTTEEIFTWNINGNNSALSVFVTANTALFTKFVSYNYNVDQHKRTMRWLDSTTDVINFIECE